MKKFVALLLVICCVATFFIFPAGAASTNNVILMVSANDETITLKIKTDFNCGGLQGVLEYDTDAITYKGISFNDEIIDNNTEKDSVRAVESGLKIAFVGDVVSGTKGEFATLTFEGDAAAFDFKNVKAFSNSVEQLTVNVVKSLEGDANCDGKVNIADLVRLDEDNADVSEINALRKLLLNK